MQIRRWMPRLCALAVVFLFLITGCSTSVIQKPSPTPLASVSGMDTAPFYPDVPGLANITAPRGYDWKQFDGVTLNFICEVNNSATVLSRESEQFTKVTGIKVNIQALDFNTLIERLNLDFVSKTAKYQIIYVDPYQTLIPFNSKLVDLQTMNKDPQLPHIPGGLSDFFRSQLDVDSYFLDRDHLYTLPFDAPTMILFYRQDVLDTYGPQYTRETGQSIEPGSKGFTWDKYLAFSKWVTANVAKSVVLYGSGHQAKKHNSLFCDFSNVLASYGGNYFKDPNIGSIGAKNPQNTIIMNGKGISALEMYKNLVQSADPRSTTWDWFSLAEAFRDGEIAMMPNWNEYASMMENTERSKVAGKVGYSLLPRGPSGSANIFGGSGIGINRDAPLKEQQAAWLYLLWATSPQTELMSLKHPEGGDVPLRKSIYATAEVKEAMVPGSEALKRLPSLKPIRSVLDAWEDENTYQRPKVKGWPQIEEAITDELYQMITQNGSSLEAAKSIARRINAITNQ